MTTPAIIYTVMIAITLLGTAYEHGKPRKDTNFWHSLIGTAISVGLLLWGGFFN